jgi:hypothetical protein
MILTERQKEIIERLGGRIGQEGRFHLSIHLPQHHFNSAYATIVTLDELHECQLRVVHSHNQPFDTLHTEVVVRQA